MLFTQLGNFDYKNTIFFSDFTLDQKKTILFYEFSLQHTGQIHRYATLTH